MDCLSYALPAERSYLRCGLYCPDLCLVNGSAHLFARLDWVPSNRDIWVDVKWETVSLPHVLWVESCSWTWEKLSGELQGEWDHLDASESLRSLPHSEEENQRIGDIVDLRLALATETRRGNSSGFGRRGRAGFVRFWLGRSRVRACIVASF
ncbi:MAG: hypothetical protein CSA62_01270 [Planctomycetota bacterium]|nr:MAG: hypothetical protein CSA62_01270 [Planctomycetota bacterium]